MVVQIEQKRVAAAVIIVALLHCCSLGYYLLGDTVRNWEYLQSKVYCIELDVLYCTSCTPLPAARILSQSRGIIRYTLASIRVHIITTSTANNLVGRTNKGSRLSS